MGHPQIAVRRAGLPKIDNGGGGATDYDVILHLPNFLVIQKTPRRRHEKKLAELTIQNPRKCRKVILKSHTYSLFRNFNIKQVNLLVW